MAAPCGSQNDQAVFETAEKLNIRFVEQYTRSVYLSTLLLSLPELIRFRLFHH